MVDAVGYQETIHPDNIKDLEAIMGSSATWDSDRLKAVLVALGTLAPGSSMRNEKRPESIHIQKLRPPIKELGEQATRTNERIARVIRVDKSDGTLKFGRMTQGFEGDARPDKAIPSGKENVQRTVGVAYAHPKDQLYGDGFTRGEFKIFLVDNEQQVMVLTRGEDTLMVAKTNLTQNNLSAESIDRRVEDTFKNTMDDEAAGRTMVDRFQSFNREMCITMGMQLYFADASRRDLLERVPLVTS